MEIRSAQTHSELQACVDLQMRVWNFPPRDVVPMHQLLAAHEWGGQVLVAVDGEQVVGFSYGFAARLDGRPSLHSHMLAVLPEYRRQGVGLALKLAQGRWARENGYRLITWTYEPLEATNAHLNIARLGGRVRHYLIDHYGPMADDLNAGLTSDRLLVEWRLDAPRVAAILSGANVAPVSSGAVTCAIPRGFQQIKRADPAAAFQWRLQVREALMAALAGGYVITGFQLEAEMGTYLLDQEGEA